MEKDKLIIPFHFDFIHCHFEQNGLMKLSLLSNFIVFFLTILFKVFLIKSLWVVCHKSFANSSFRGFSQRITVEVAVNEFQ